jgi:hypothetical protein
MKPCALGIEAVSFYEAERSKRYSQKPGPEGHAQKLITTSSLLNYTSLNKKTEALNLLRFLFFLFFTF